MGKKTEALKRVAVAFGYGSSVADYKGTLIVEVLKELAVKMECATSIEEIRETTTAGVLNYIADNKGSEEHEPYDLVVTASNVVVKVKRKGKIITPASDILYNGDVLTITAEPQEGYELATLTLNGTTIESGDTFTVNGHNVTILATGSLKTFALERDATDCTVAVTKDGVAVEDGETALTYGDTVVITATAEEGYQMESLKVNGEDFVSGEELTVNEDVEIVAVATGE